MSIRRKQESKEIKCNAPTFDDYVCMSYSDLQKFYNTFVLGCQKWRSDMPKMSVEEAAQLMQEARIQPVIREQNQY